MFLHSLKRLLNAAMPELEDASKEKLLLHHLIAGLPEQCARQLRILPEIKTTADALRRAQLIIDQVGSAAQEETVMAIGGESKLAKLEHQVQYLTQKLTEVLEGRLHFRSLILPSSTAKVQLTIVLTHCLGRVTSCVLLLEFWLVTLLKRIYELGNMKIAH